MSAAPHVLFAGGGVTSHLFPGLAVAAHLAKQLPAARITFAGCGKARERHTVRTAGYEYLTIPARPTPQTPWHALRYVTDNVVGYCAARWMLREQQVSLVVGLGGYTSAAMVHAAAARDVPVLLLEQNAIPSRTTRWSSRSAAMVCAAFEEVRPHLPVQAQMTVTGSPVRAPFEVLYQKTNRAHSPLDKDRARTKRLVILGGAGGARSLNESMPAALKQLGDTISTWQIVHQTGEGQLQETERRYRDCGVDALAVTYIDEIASVLFASDLVVCRPGGTTLAELALAGVPAILVPFLQAADDHQAINAKVFSTAGAARTVDESAHGKTLSAALAREVQPLVIDELRRQKMAHNMRQLARPQASADIAEAICNTLGCSHSRRMAA